MSEVVEDITPTITINEKYLDEGSVEKSLHDLGDGRTYIEDFDENGNLIAKKWLLNGKLHREGAPSLLIYYANGVLKEEHYRVNDKYNNNNKTDSKYAMTYPCANFYKEDGSLYAEAFLMNKDGEDYEYYLQFYDEDGICIRGERRNNHHALHSEFHPALEKFDKDSHKKLLQVWYMYGKRHNDYGVAYKQRNPERDSVIEAFYLNGEQLTPEEWNKNKRDRKTGLRYVRSYSNIVNFFLGMIMVIMMVPYLMVATPLSRVLGIESSSIGVFLYLTAYSFVAYPMNIYVNHVIALAKNDTVEMRNTKNYFWNFAGLFVLGLILYALSSLLVYVFGTTPYISAVLEFLKVNFFGFIYGLSILGAILAIPILAAKLFAKYRH